MIKSILKSNSIILFVIIILSYPVTEIFAQEDFSDSISIIRDDVNKTMTMVSNYLSEEDKNTLVPIISTLIPSISIIITVVITLSRYKQSQDIRKDELKLRRQEMLFHLINEAETTENSEKMFLAISVLDNFSCEVPTNKNNGNINKSTFEYYLSNFKEFDLNKILRPHDEPITDEKERAIRQSFDALLDYFCMIEYMHSADIITDQELNYFRYFVLIMKDNNAIRNYIERYKIPLSNNFFDQVKIISENDLQKRIKKRNRKLTKNTKENLQYTNILKWE
jgi:hypothetical protein